MIAHVAPFFYPEIGGMENAVLNQCKELVKMGNEVHVYTCNRFRNGVKIRRKTDEIYGVKVHYLKSYFHIEKAHFFPSILTALTSEFDIIHTHAIHHPHNDLAAFSAKIRHKKTVFTSHSSFFPKSAVPTYQHFLFQVYDATARFSIFRNADRIIALTPYDRRELVKRGVDGRKVCIIPNGVEKKYFESNSDEYENLKQRYRLDGEIVLNVGRINKVKGLDVLVQAFPMVVKQNNDAKLVLIGQDEGFYAHLKSLADRLGIGKKLVWLNRLGEEEKVAMYHMCDVFCLPSASEPFGIVILEAQASGKPVVATKTGGVPYIIKNKETGLLVPPGNPSRVAKAINTILADDQLRDDMGRKAKKWASNFVWENISRRILSLYIELTTKWSR